jgi:hypothetical protein
MVALSEVRSDLRHENELSLSLIGLGKFKDALAAISSSRAVVPKLDLQQIFNYAVAEWADSRQVPKDLLEIVVQQASSFNHPNPQQCFGLAYWLLGHKSEAKDHLQKALKLGFARAYAFSCWRYRELPTGQFVRDVTDMLSNLKDDAPPLPLFLTEHDRPT